MNRASTTETVVSGSIDDQVKLKTVKTVLTPFQIDV